MGISASIDQYRGNLDNVSDLINKKDKKEICYIGSKYCFENNVMENYEENIGIFTLKDGWKYLTQETQERMTEFLEKRYYENIKYTLLREDLYINLGY